MESWWPVRRGGELVGYLNDAEHARFVKLCEPCTAAAGDSVFQKGSPSRSLLLVEEGELEVYDESLGQAVILARVGPGGVVGEVGFLDGQPRTHYVRARAACRLRRLTRDAFVSLVESDPGLFAKLAVGLAQLLTFRFRSAVEELEPIRSFAAALREPLDLEEQNLRFDEIEMPLPEEDPDRKKTDPDTRPLENPAAEAVKVIRRVARRGRKKGGSAGV